MEKNGVVSGTIVIVSQQMVQGTRPAAAALDTGMSPAAPHSPAQAFADLASRREIQIVYTVSGSRTGNEVVLLVHEPGSDGLAATFNGTIAGRGELRGTFAVSGVAGRPVTLHRR
jgi:hypothetical protein